jgi:hypothetical protein
MENQYSPKRPTYSVLIGTRDKDGNVAYFFQCNDPETDPPEGAILDGKKVLYCGTDYVKMRDPHDALVFCNYLNETSKNA